MGFCRGEQSTDELSLLCSDARPFVPWKLKVTPVKCGWALACCVIHQGLPPLNRGQPWNIGDISSNNHGDTLERKSQIRRSWHLSHMSHVTCAWSVYLQRLTHLYLVPDCSELRKQMEHSCKPVEIKVGEPVEMKKREAQPSSDPWKKDLNSSQWHRIKEFWKHSVSTITIQCRGHGWEEKRQSVIPTGQWRIEIEKSTEEGLVR